MVHAPLCSLKGEWKVVCVGGAVTERERGGGGVGDENEVKKIRSKFDGLYMTIPQDSFNFYT